MAGGRGGERAGGEIVASGQKLAARGHLARADDLGLTLDVSNGVPETDADLTKLDLGPMTVAAVDAAGRDVAVLGALPYSEYERAAYERSAGVVTLPLTLQAAKAARENDLALRDASGTALAVEARLRAIPETPNHYRDEGQPTTALFQV